ncbi:MAG: Ser/Thr protein phosphatase family protein [Fibrobacteres bacterium]|nr:Ser/Thr protein phosphatase family protein [Fibrobacterota bacterium]
MKYGIYSDIHGNLEALQRVLESMKRLGVDKKVCLGDIVGYGPFPNECVELVAENSDITILGNHDSVAIGRESSEGWNNYNAQKAIEWTSKVLTPASIDFFSKLPYMVSEPPLLFVHASPWSPADWKYVSSLDDAVDAFSFFTEKICFIGHTHWPIIVIMEGEQSFKVSETLLYTLEPNQRILVNDGSVGQPRDRNPLASWCLCDTEKLTVEIIRVAYDISKTQAAMKKSGFAEFLINRLSEGR